MKRELLRKAIHISGILLIPLLLWKREVFSLVCLALLAIYLFSEWCLKKGFSLPLLTTLNLHSKRDHERDHLSKGAVFLLLSAAILPFLFGIQASAIGLSQTFIGDAFAGVLGKKFGHKKIPFSPEKSWAGSLAFFVSAFLITLYFVPIRPAFFFALAGTLLEALPLPDYDNVIIPVGVSLLAYLFI